MECASVRRNPVEWGTVTEHLPCLSESVFIEVGMSSAGACNISVSIAPRTPRRNRVPPEGPLSCRHALKGESALAHRRRPSSKVKQRYSIIRRTGLILDSRRTGQPVGLQKSALRVKARFNPCRDSAGCTIVMQSQRRRKSHFLM
jgi:hypothetical protein